MQEIYARLILYNYCELITMHVIIQQKGTKHVYQMNYTIADADTEESLTCKSRAFRPSQSQA